MSTVNPKTEKDEFIINIKVLKKVHQRLLEET